MNSGTYSDRNLPELEATLQKAKTQNPQQIVGFTDNLLVKPAIFKHFSTRTGTSPENVMAKPEPVPEQNCWYVAGCW
jgi:hypothetical protein